MAQNYTPYRTANLKTLETNYVRSSNRIGNVQSLAFSDLSNLRPPFNIFVYIRLDNNAILE